MWVCVCDLKMKLENRSYWSALIQNSSDEDLLLHRAGILGILFEAFCHDYQWSRDTDGNIYP